MNLTTFATLLTDVSLLRRALAAALLLAAIFAYISGSSFVLRDFYGLSPQAADVCIP